MGRQLQDAVCYLLQLPAELRNSIWELAATENERSVAIGKSVKPPAWTLACRQVRKEAFPLWLLSNTFAICVQSDTDIKNLIAFEEFCARHISTKKMNVEVTFPKNMSLFDTPLTGKVVASWALHIRASGHWRPKRDGCNNLVSVALTASLEMAEKTRGLGEEGSAEIMNLLDWSMREASKYGG